MSGKYRWIVMCMIMLLLCSAKAHGQVEKGDRYFAMRAKGSTGEMAKKRNIIRAIRCYEQSDTSPDVIAKLLRAYEFKGSYTRMKDEDRIEIFKKAVDLGRQAIDKYPEHVGVKYYLLTNLGRWGENLGVAKAAEEGISEEMRSLAEEIIKLDAGFSDAGGLRILGILHLKVPSIPFVLTWPSKEKAEHLLKQAYEVAPENPANVKFYAELLVEIDQEKSARSLLASLENTDPREDMIIEDRVNLKAARKLIESLN